MSLSLKRKDRWPSRAEAAKSFRKAYGKWDPRVVDIYIKHGVKDDPTQPKGSVTLATSKHQEVVKYMRPNFQNKKPLNGVADAGSLDGHDSVFYPDIIGPPNTIYPFYRYEPIILWGLMKHIRPSVLYLYGGKSPISTPDDRERKLERTGRGIGGSGGRKNGRVMDFTFPSAGHALPFEAVKGVSEVMSAWLTQEVVRWKEEEERIQKDWVDLKQEARTSTSNEWLIHLKTYFDGTQKASSKL